MRTTGNDEGRPGTVGDCWGKLGEERVMSYDLDWILSHAPFVWEPHIRGPLCPSLPPGNTPRALTNDHPKGSGSF